MRLLPEFVDDPNNQDCSDANLFHVLGRYTQRQQENLLTQALVFLFNHVEPFRAGLYGHISTKRQFVEKGPPRIRAETQVRYPEKKGAQGAVIVDMVIYRGDKEDFLIECKLDAPLGPNQLRRYRHKLSKLKLPGSNLVIITRFGRDESLAEEPHDAIWLSWSEVCELAEQATKRTSTLYKFLLRHFLEYMAMKGVLPSAGMRSGDWPQLKSFWRFLVNPEAPPKKIVARAIISAEVAIERLRALRDAAWQGLFRDNDGWRPYDEIFRDTEKDRHYVVLAAGYWRRSAKKDIDHEYVGLELWLRGSEPTLNTVYGWRITSNHEGYERGDPYVSNYGPHWSPKNTKALLAMSLSKIYDAKKKNHTVFRELRNVATSFAKSHSPKT